MVILRFLLPRPSVLRHLKLDWISYHKKACNYHYKEKPHHPIPQRERGACQDYPRGCYTLTWSSLVPFFTTHCRDHVNTGVTWRVVYRSTTDLSCYSTQRLTKSGWVITQEHHIPECLSMTFSQIRKSFLPRSCCCLFNLNKESCFWNFMRFVSCLLFES